MKDFTALVSAERATMQSKGKNLKKFTRGYVLQCTPPITRMSISWYSDHKQPLYAGPLTREHKQGEWVRNSHNQVEMRPNIPKKFLPIS